MEPESFLILMTASAVNMALPGPGILLALTRSSCGGLAAGAGVSAGFLLSGLILATGAVLILAGLMELSPRALSVLRWAGLAVILWIALRLVFGPGTGAAPGHPGAGDVLAGVALGLSSPFNLVFLLALLPQFAPERMSAESAVAMIAAYLAGQALVLAPVSVLGAAAGRALLGRPRARLFERLAGVTLAAFAVAAAASPI